MATTDQYKRFVANEPESQRELRTIELWHSQFASVYRFVNDYSNLTASLESGAPRDPDASVVFTAATLNIEEPGERSDTEQILSLSVGATDDVLAEIVEQISGSGYFEPMQVIYRKYYSGDLTMPAVTPLYLSASGVNFDNENTATVTAEDADLTTKRVGIIYTEQLFPGISK